MHQGNYLGACARYSVDRALNNRFFFVLILQRLDLEGDSVPDVLLLCQHNPVYTLGRRLSENEIDAKRLADLGAEYYAVRLYMR